MFAGRLPLSVAAEVGGRFRWWWWKRGAGGYFPRARCAGVDPESSEGLPRSPAGAGPQRPERRVGVEDALP